MKIVADRVKLKYVVSFSLVCTHNINSPVPFLSLSLPSWGMFWLATEKLLATNLISPELSLSTGHRN